MKIAKSWKRNPETCAAVRCKTQATSTVLGECFDLGDAHVPLCERHTSEATAAHKLWEVPGAVRSLDGAPAVVPEVAGALAPVGLEAELRDEADEAQGVLAELDGFQIATQDELEFVAGALAETKGNIKRLEARKKEITGPINEALKSVRDLFAPPLTFLKETETALKRLIADASKREQQDNTDAIEAAADAIDVGDMSGTAEALAGVRHTSNVHTLRTRDVWAFRVTDESKVPRELCEVSPKKIRAYVREHNGAEPTAVAGVEFFLETVVASGSK